LIAHNTIVVYLQLTTGRDSSMRQMVKSLHFAEFPRTRDAGKELDLTVDSLFIMTQSLGRG